MWISYKKCPVDIFFYVADFAEERHFYKFKALVGIAVQKPHKNNSTNSKFIISTSRIWNWLNVYFT